VSEVDQDGGEIDTYSFNDARHDVQQTILKDLGISEDQAWAALEIIDQLNNREVSND
jgi:hypothetical protein